MAALLCVLIVFAETSSNTWHHLEIRTTEETSVLKYSILPEKMVILADFYL